MSATVNVDETDHDVAATTMNGGVGNMTATSGEKHENNDGMLEIDLNNGNHPLSQTPSPNSHPAKANWVKFDEEGNGNASDITLSPAATTTQPKQTQQPSKVSPIKLSPPPPTRAKKSHSRSTAATASAPVAATTTNSAVNNNGIGLLLPAPAAQNLRTSPLPSRDATPAVLTTESIHVNLNHSTSIPPQKPNGQQSMPSTPIPNNNSQTTVSVPKMSSVSIPISPAAPMRTIELSTGRVREGFANGDVIVTLLPINSKWPWVTPAVFRPELVPEELMAQGLTLTVEEYVTAMETLVNDYRFTAYNICYKRVLVCWILIAFCVLLSLLFSGLQGIALFSLGVGWLFLNAAVIFLCMWAKLRLARGLEKCLARVNKQLMRHKILLVLDDRGRISCHKVNLCFIYFDPAQCVAYLNEFIERSEQNGSNIQAGWEAKLDLDVNDIVIQGANPTRLSRKQAVAQEIFLSYLQRWGKDFLRRRLDWTVNEAGVHETPRHLQSSICPCQYEEEILINKIKSNTKRSCSGAILNCCL